MKMKNALCGALCGALVFSVLSWVAPRKTANAAVLATPPEGRFELVQLHPNATAQWSGILDTETGCTWVYTSQTPPTDAEVSAAKGDAMITAMYGQQLGSHYFGNVGYEYSDSDLSRAEPGKPPTSGESKLVTLAAEEFYCNQARQHALQAAAAR